jgi:hypothetical protein
MEFACFCYTEVSAVNVDSKQSSACYLVYAGFLISISATLKMEASFPPEPLLTFSEVNDVLSQKLEQFITAAVRTAYPTLIIINRNKPHLFRIA